MQPITERRQPRETFYFEQFELHIDQAVLPEHVPEVTNIDGQSVIAKYRNNRGEEHGQDFAIRHDLDPGEQLLEIVASDGLTREFDHRGRWVATADGEQIASYVVQPNDILILQDQNGLDDGITLAPSDEPLPKREDKWNWRPLGIMTTEGKLITWHGTSAQARRLVELCVANWVVRPGADSGTDIDCRNLLYEFGSGRSLKAMLEGDAATSTYLNWFFEEFSGVDFWPIQEPRDASRPSL